MCLVRVLYFNLAPGSAYKGSEKIKIINKQTNIHTYMRVILLYYNFACYMRTSRAICTYVICENSNFNIKISPVPINIYSEVGSAQRKRKVCIKIPALYTLFETHNTARISR